MTPQLVPQPIVMEAAGTPTKIIAEYIGHLATEDSKVSIAVMDSPEGWSEPGQTPAFDEYSVVFEGELTVHWRDGELKVGAGQAVHAPAGEWVRYSTPATTGARYVSVCLPAFSPETVHRDDGDGSN